MEFASLVVAAVAWFLLHAAVAGSGLRFWLIARFGEKAYRAGFSLASLVALWWLIHEYRSAPYVALGTAPQVFRLLSIVVVPVAFVLLVGAFTAPSATTVGGERLLESEAEPRGMQRITRHPFLWGVVLWALAHAVANPDAGSLLFFSSLGVTALNGTFDIDRKRRRVNPQGYARLAAVTSNLPLAAVLRGNNRVVVRELSLPLLLGLVLTIATVLLHQRFFGAPAVPGITGF